MFTPVETFVEAFVASETNPLPEAIAASPSTAEAEEISGYIVVNIVAGGEVAGEPMIVASLGVPTRESGGGRENERRRETECEGTINADRSIALGALDEESQPR